MNTAQEPLLQRLTHGRFTARAVVLLGIGGMVLILLSELLPAKTAAPAAASGTADDLAYAQQMETRLETLIGQVDGAGRTAVMVTLENGEEREYAVDTREGDAESETTHVLLGDGSALTQTVYAPRICGVAVVCEGGDQAGVEVRITELLSSLLGISTNRISVEKMN